MFWLVAKVVKTFGKCVKCRDILNEFLCLLNGAIGLYPIASQKIAPRRSVDVTVFLHPFALFGNGLIAFGTGRKKRKKTKRVCLFKSCKTLLSETAPYTFNHDCHRNLSNDFQLAIPSFRILLFFSAIVLLPLGLAERNGKRRKEFHGSSQCKRLSS